MILGLNNQLILKERYSKELSANFEGTFFERATSSLLNSTLDKVARKCSFPINNFVLLRGTCFTLSQITNVSLSSQDKKQNIVPPQVIKENARKNTFTIIKFTICTHKINVFKPYVSAK
jgi:hypothetical protein